MTRPDIVTAGRITLTLAARRKPPHYEGTLGNVRICVDQHGSRWHALAVCQRDAGVATGSTVAGAAISALARLRVVEEQSIDLHRERIAEIIDAMGEA